MLYEIFISKNVVGLKKDHTFAFAHCDRGRDSGSSSVPEPVISLSAGLHRQSVNGNKSLSRFSFVENKCSIRLSNM